MLVNILFVCSLNKIRSRTAEVLFSSCPGLHVRSAGTQSNARIVVNTDHIRWADIIFTMEQKHTQILYAKYRDILQNKKIYCLFIEDEYAYMDEYLVNILQTEVGKHITFFQ